MSEFLLTGIQILDIQLCSFLLVEPKRNLSITLLHLIKEGRSDGESVNSTEILNLVSVSEWSSHYDSFDVVRAIVVENVSDKNNSWIFNGVFICFSMFLFVPIQNSTNEGRNQEEIAVGTGNCLNQVEYQSHIYLNVLFC